MALSKAHPALRQKISETEEAIGDLRGATAKSVPVRTLIDGSVECLQPVKLGDAVRLCKVKYRAVDGERVGRSVPLAELTAHDQYCFSKEKHLDELLNRRKVTPGSWVASTNAVAGRSARLR